MDKLNREKFKEIDKWIFSALQKLDPNKRPSEEELDSIFRLGVPTNTPPREMRYVQTLELIILQLKSKFNAFELLDYFLVTRREREREEAGKAFLDGQTALAQEVSEQEE